MPELTGTRINMRLVVGMVSVLLVCLMLVSCTSTPTGRPVSVVDVSNVPDEESVSAEPTPLIDEPETPSHASPAPPAAPAGMPYGWIIQNEDSLASPTWIPQAAAEGVTHIQLSSRLIGRLDEIPFSVDRQRQIQSLAQTADGVGIDVLLQASELAMDAGMFRFHPADPFTAARKAAYRNVLNLIPEVDGIVLSLGNAPTPPWEGDLPPGADMLFPMQRIRFVVEMVQEVVVGEMQRQLVLAIVESDERQRRWIADALESSGHTTIPTQLHADVSPDEFSRHPRWSVLDAAGNSVGGANSLAVIGGLQDMSRLLDANKRNGIVAQADTPGESRSRSMDYNRFMLAELTSPAPFIEEGLRLQWLQQRYSISPGTREAAVLDSIYQSAARWGETLFVFGGINTSDWIFTSPEPRETTQPLATPGRTMDISPLELTQVTALAQESLEVIESIEQTMEDLLSIRSYLRPADFSLLSRQLEHTADVARLVSDMKQVTATFPLWKRTWNEQEALVLEAHLQAMETRLVEWQGSIATPHGSLSSQQLTEWCQSYREHFPRVLVGATPREWNRIHDIRIQQNGPNQVVVRFETDRPSQIAITASSGEVQLPSDLPGVGNTSHQIMIRNLQAGGSFWLQVKATDTQGQVTYSGVQPFELESEPSL